MDDWRLAIDYKRLRSRSLLTSAATGDGQSRNCAQAGVLAPYLSRILPQMEPRYLGCYRGWVARAEQDSSEPNRGVERYTC